MTIRITKRQMELLVKEATAPGEDTVLTEAELNELAPVLATLHGALGKTATAVSQAVSKGVDIAAKKLPGLLAKTKTGFKTMTAAMMKAAQKLGPELKAMMKMVKKPEDLKIILNTSDPKIKKQVAKLMKSLGTSVEKADDCDCPTPEEYKKSGGLMKKLMK